MNATPTRPGSIEERGNPCALVTAIVPALVAAGFSLRPIVARFIAPTRWSLVGSYENCFLPERPGLCYHLGETGA